MNQVIFPESKAETKSAEALAAVFNHCFAESENTRIETGASEPYYVPENVEAAFSDGKLISPKPYARIFSRDDYPSSVLHEVAHWCIAGTSRRALLDYGYWYEPDGRNAAQQAQFEQVEVKPQALERIISCAAGLSFRLSADNVTDPMARPSESFRKAVHTQTAVYLSTGVPSRALLFAQALDVRFGGQGRFAKIGSYPEADLL